MNINISDIISLIGILTSLFISTITLLYNAKIVRDSLKPDIQLYLDYLSSDDNQYLLLKNFGKTGSTIKNIKHNLPDENCIANHIKSVNEIYLAPNQVVYFPFSSKELENKYHLNVITFEFEYDYGLKKIKTIQNIDLSLKTLHKNFPPDEPLKNISLSLTKLLMK